MQPYSKDTHSQPTVNVNLKPCDDMCSSKWQPEWVAPRHSGDCAPVLVPLSLQPFRSVTFTVRLVECTMGCQSGPINARPVDGHWNNCPARPIRVSCSISGKTWEESEAQHVSTNGREDGEGVAFTACRALWDMVKALVLGGRLFPSPVSDAVVELVAQRDAVYAALADMVRAEKDAHAAEERIPHEIRDSVQSICYWHATLPEDRPSASILARYVERLVEQVGVL